MVDFSDLKIILKEDVFTDLLSVGFTLKELYERFDNDSLSFKDFSKRFFDELSGSFTYNSKRKIWELNIEEVEDIQTKSEDLPKLADQLLEFVRLNIETYLTNYLNGMSQEEFRRLVTPLIKEAVKDEFSSKVIPAVINNLREHASKLISEVETNQENLIRSLIHEKFQEYEGRIKKLEKKLSL